MDYIVMEIIRQARATGMSLTEYLKNTYSQDELEDLQNVIQMELTACQVDIDTFCESWKDGGTVLDYNLKTDEELLKDQAVMQYALGREIAEMSDLTAAQSKTLVSA